MTLRLYRTFQALILAGLGFYLLSKVVDGRVMLYISQRFVPLVLLAGVGMIFLAQLVMRERSSSHSSDPEATGATHADHEHDHEKDQRSGWMLWLIALPLLIGVLAPVRPLSTSALASRGIRLTSGFASDGESLAVQLPSPLRSVLDWLRVFAESEDPSIYNGQAADVTGFVYHDLRLGTNTFMVGRFTIACCVADAMALGMVVDWPEAPGLLDNQWVRVRGKVYALQMDGKTIPAITAEQIEVVPQPEQPYLFP